MQEELLRPNAQNSQSTFPILQEIQMQQQTQEEDQTKDLYKMIDQGIVYYKNGQYTFAKVVLFRSSSTLLSQIKQNKISEQEKPMAMEKLQDGIRLAEQCNKQITQKQKQIAQNDPYCQQIIETSMIRKIDVSFEEIIGLEHIKNQLEETIILPNLRPDIYTGIRAPPKGILFYGPPGNGKTLLAKAVANQIKCCFFNISASTLVQKHLGEGEKLMSALFKVAFQLQPSVIFVDEIDSILSKRSQNEHEASRRLKTEFLISFDGIQSSDQDRVFLIAATNRPQDIDDAVLRRFTVKILIDQPEYKVRVEMVKSLLSKVKNNLTEQQLQQIAENLQGYSASDIVLLLINLIYFLFILIIQIYNYKFLIELTTPNFVYSIYCYLNVNLNQIFVYYLQYQSCCQGSLYATIKGRSISHLLNSQSGYQGCLQRRL